MGNSDKQQHLDALSFLYLTFSHATDEQLTRDEMRTLADKVRQWEPDASLEVIGEMLKSAVATYKSFESHARKLHHAGECAALLKDNMSDDQLKTVLEDLLAIAAADGEVSEAEKSFISTTAKALGVELEA